MVAPAVAEPSPIAPGEGDRASVKVDARVHIEGACVEACADAVEGASAGNEVRGANTGDVAGSPLDGRIEVGRKRHRAELCVTFCANLTSSWPHRHRSQWNSPKSAAGQEFTVGANLPVG